MKMPKHPGFKKVAMSIAMKEHMPMKEASAILANASRKASPAAKRRNSRLKRVG
jgi:hypothetical protein